MGNAKNEASAKNTKKKKGYSGRELSLFCSQLALVLRSGITLLDGLHTMLDDSEDKQEQELFTSMIETMEDGGYFSQALEKTGLFPDYMVNMTEIGEKSGRLENVLESLSAFYEREDSLRQNIRSAIIYPAVLMVMMVAVLLVIVVKVLPVFQKVFHNLGADMSSTATSIMNFGLAASKYAVFIALALVAVILVLACFSKTKRGGELFTGVSSKIPGLNRLCDKIASGRFASALSLMLSSGYDAEEALDLIPNVLPNGYVRNKVLQLKEKVKDGASLAEAIRDSKVFPKLYSKILVVGFRTGSVDEVMERLSEYYEEETDSSLNNFVAILEPTLVAVLCIIIGIIMVSVMLPLIGIMSSIG